MPHPDVSCCIPKGSSYKGSVIEAFPLAEVLGSGQWQKEPLKLSFPTPSLIGANRRATFKKKTNITRMVPISSDSMVVVVVTVQDLDAAKASEEKRRKAAEWCGLSKACVS